MSDEMTTDQLNSAELTDAEPIEATVETATDADALLPTGPVDLTERPTLTTTWTQPAREAPATSWKQPRAESEADEESGTDSVDVDEDSATEDGEADGEPATE